MVIDGGWPELLATATASFLLGWTLRNSTISKTFGNLRVPPVTKTKMVIVVRSDLSMSKGKLAAQCSHAAVSCYRKASSKYPTISALWVSSGEPKIIVRADTPGEEGIRQLAQKAIEIGLVATIVRDAGRTEVSPGTVTVLGIGPDKVDKVDEVTSNLKTL